MFETMGTQELEKCWETAVLTGDSQTPPYWSGVGDGKFR